MAARVNKIRHDEETRAKIKTSQLVNRLTGHVLGTVEMVPSQVTAALGLLKKTLPDLTAVEHSGEVTKNYVARMPAPVKGMDEWQSRYTPTPPTMTKQ